MKLGGNTGENLWRSYTGIGIDFSNFLFDYWATIWLFSFSFLRCFTRSADKIIACSTASSPVQLWKHTALGLTKVFIETFLYQRRIKLENVRNALTLLTVYWEFKIPPHRGSAFTLDSLCDFFFKIPSLDCTMIQTSKTLQEAQTSIALLSHWKPWLPAASSPRQTLYQEQALR